MSAPATDQATPWPTTWKRPGLIANPLLQRGAVALIVLYFLWSIGSLEIDWLRAVQGFERAGKLFGRIETQAFEMARDQLLSQGPAGAPKLH